VSRGAAGGPAAALTRVFRSMGVPDHSRLLSSNRFHYYEPLKPSSLQLQWSEIEDAPAMDRRLIGAEWREPCAYLAIMGFVGDVVSCFNMSYP